MPENGDINTTFTFNADASTTPHQYILEYFWASYNVFARYLYREKDALLGTVSEDYYSKEYAFSVR